MLSKKVFKEQMERLLIFFPNWNINIERKEVMLEWYKMFEEYSDEALESAVTKYVSCETYQPTVAVLVKKIKEYRVPYSNREISYEEGLENAKRKEAEKIEATKKFGFTYRETM